MNNTADQEERYLHRLVFFIEENLQQKRKEVENYEDLKDREIVFLSYLKLIVYQYFDASKLVHLELVLVHYVFEEFRKLILSKFRANYRLSAS